ncbi:MAG: hypothetical protein J6U10_03260, partial [Lachnospiraceae bacterium]|nr:hypothetical protein [Lachnospiraceae bacterium]
KKKRKHHLFLIILLLVLIIGILLGLLIDRGILFPGGEGWIGGVVGSIKEVGKGNEPIDLNTTITPNPSPVPTHPVDESAPKVYIKVSGQKITMNDVEITAEGILAQLNTDTYNNSIVYLIDDYAAKGVYENLRTLLQNKGRSIELIEK